MKTLILAACFLASLSSNGQKLKPGVGPFDKKDFNMFSVAFKEGGLAAFIDRIKQDLGPGSGYSDGGEGYPGIRWIGVQNSAWGQKRIIIQMYWVATESRQIANISCVDASGDDLLIPDTEMAGLLQKYLKKKL